MAAEFRVTAQSIPAQTGAAQRQLVLEGMTAGQLCAAVRLEKQAGAPPSAQSLAPSSQRGEALVTGMIGLTGGAKSLAQKAQRQNFSPHSL